jgi:hypothetical protein
LANKAIDAKTGTPSSGVPKVRVRRPGRRPKGIGV